MKGYIALTTVLILIPLLLLTGIDSLYSNLTSLSVADMNYDSQILKSHAETCLEESVYKLKRDTSFTGDYMLSSDDWSCTVSISDKVGFSLVKVMSVHAVMGDSVVVLDRELDMNTEPFTLRGL